MVRLPLLFLLSACSGMDFAVKDDGEFSPESDNLPAGTLRIDLEAPAGVAEPALLPQSRTIYPRQVDGARYADLELQMQPTVLISGTLTAEVSHVWAAVDTPTERIPLAGEVRALVDASVQQQAAETDEFGYFEFAAVADDRYDLSIVPSDASLSPVHVVDGLDFTSAVDLSQTLTSGAPLYGKLTTADGSPLANVPIRIHRTDVGSEVRSKTVTTDRTGWYVARVEAPGEFEVEVLGRYDVSGDVVPAITTPVTVADDSGATVFIDAGTLDDASISGTLEDAFGDPLGDATVIARAITLDGAEGTLVSETETDANGAFVTHVLPGTYELDLIPAFTTNPTASPTRIELTVPPGETRLGLFPVPPISSLMGTVFSASDAPAAGVAVSVTQDDFGHHTYTTRTDDSGAYSIAVPDAAYTITAAPPAGVIGALTREPVLAGENGDVDLLEGETVSGRVVFDGEAVAYALVVVREFHSEDVLGTTTTDADGYFALSVNVPEPDADATGTATDGDDTGTGSTTPEDTGGTATSGTTGDTGSDTGR